MTEDVKTYTYKLDMKCMKCLKKVSAALDELKDKGLKEYNMLFEEQLVEVKATLPPERILDALKTTGKDVTLVTTP